MAIRRRGAFTLVELLVVITIIGMLMALLLPAVNAAVEAGRNTQCKNNIRNLGIAVDSFQNSSGYYPAYSTSYGSPTPQAVSWVVTLLPQFERLDLYQDWGNSAITVANKSPYLELLVCPSDPPEQIGGPILSYVANSGCATAGKETKDGIFHVAPIQVTVDSIVDGKSNTLCFSENIQATKWDVATREGTTFVWHTSDPPPTDAKINQNKTTAAVSINSARPSSFHSGGVNVAFCDTHVLFLKEEVDYKVYAQLMTPNYRESSMPAAWQVPLDDSKYK
jgi:prepilin-type N-terminal cleavage/methylation domain-containing protein/prepilin-type processing-associated H-X9-DG protein